MCTNKTFQSPRNIVKKDVQGKFDYRSDSRNKPQKIHPVKKVIDLLLAIDPPSPFMTPILFCPKLYVVITAECLQPQNRSVHGLTMMHKIVNNIAPTYLTSKIRYHNNLHNYNTRNKNKIVVGISRTATYDHSFFPTFSRLYNDLNAIKNSSEFSVSTIKNHARLFVINKRI